MEETEFSDEALILRFQDGNRGALEEIYNRYKNRILNFCIRFLGNRAEAEDITGEVFLALFEGKYKLNRNAKFSTWLFTIARNKSISRLRKRKHTTSSWQKSGNDKELIEIEAVAHDDLASEEMIKKEEASAVQRAIQKLIPEQREAILLREYQQFSYAEIAEVLDCSLEKVKVLIFRAREFLRVELLSSAEEGDG